MKTKGITTVKLANRYSLLRRLEGDFKGGENPLNDNSTSHLPTHLAQQLSITNVSSLNRWQRSMYMRLFFFTKLDFSVTVDQTVRAGVKG